MRKLKILTMVASISIILVQAQSAPLLSFTNYSNSESDVFVYNFSSTGFSASDPDTLGVAMPSQSICLYSDQNCLTSPVRCTTAIPAENSGMKFGLNPSNFFTMGLTISGLNAFATNYGIDPSSIHCLSEVLNYSVYNGSHTISPTQSIHTCPNLNHSGNSFANTPSCNEDITFTGS